jgi:sialic acid synthase SpsE
MENNIFERLKGRDGPFFIAEISSNHNGDVERAKQLVDFAIDAGADAVKFASWSKTSLFSKKVYEGREKHAAQNEKEAMTPEMFKEMKKYCDEKKILVSSTPSSFEDVDTLVQENVRFLKVMSQDVTFLPFLEYVGKTGLPIVLSIGMASMGEIETAIETIYKTGNKKIILLQCVSNYPTEDEQINLRTMEWLKDTFHLPVGLSDHTVGRAAPVAATALGACMIEKHIMLMDGQPTREQSFALPAQDLKELVDNVKRVPYMLGTKGVVLTANELDERKRMRRSLITKFSMKAGEIITKDHITFKRPGTGIPPTELKYILGKRLNVDLGEDEVIHWEHLE